MFSLRHDVLPLIQNWYCKRRRRVTHATNGKCGQTDHVRSDAVRFRLQPELGEGEEHRESMVKDDGHTRQATDLRSGRISDGLVSQSELGTSDHMKALCSLTTVFLVGVAHRLDC
jgi:hypothetical protein